MYNYVVSVIIKITEYDRIIDFKQEVFMKRRKRIATLSTALLVIFFLAACSAGLSDTDTEASAERPGSGGIFSNFEALDINNNKVTQTIFSGKKLTMVNIWATFCGPCIREMPDLKVLSEEYSDQDFQVVGIPVDVTDRKGTVNEELLAAAREIITKTGANYVHILPSKSLLQAKLNQVSSVPETVFVDENGRQVGKSYLGSRTKAQWAKIIDALLEQVT